MTEETATPETVAPPPVETVVDPRAEFLAPLKALVTSPEWTKVLEEITALQPIYQTDPTLFIHVNGVVLTMMNLKNTL